MSMHCWIKAIKLHAKYRQNFIVNFTNSISFLFSFKTLKRLSMKLGFSDFVWRLIFLVAHSFSFEIVRYLVLLFNIFLFYFITSSYYSNVLECFWVDASSVFLAHHINRNSESVSNIQLYHFTIFQNFISKHNVTEKIFWKIIANRNYSLNYSLTLNNYTLHC